MTKYVYTFGGKTAEGNASMKNELGGKGANLAEMCLLKLPNAAQPITKTIANFPLA